MIIKKNEKDCIAIVSSHILEEDVVIIPTDTIYGFSALSSNSAKKKISLIKRREVSKQLIYLISKKEDALKYIDTSYYAEETMKILFSLWPNPLTIIFKSPLLEGTVALRYPDNSWLQNLISQVGSPIFSTSANISGKPVINNVERLKKKFSKDVSIIVDGGNLEGSSSTILDATCTPFKILRQGCYIFDEKTLKKLGLDLFNE